MEITVNGIVINIISRTEGNLTRTPLDDVLKD